MCAGAETKAPAEHMDDDVERKEFLYLFDTHADELFSYCVGRIQDHARAYRLIEETFLRGWDRVVQGEHMRLKEFYGLLDELMENVRESRHAFLPRVFSYFSRRVERSS